MHLGTEARLNGVPVSLLKECFEVTLPLRVLLESSLRDGAVPETWETAVVTSHQFFFKDGESSEAKIYIPVSLTSNVPKLYERVLVR